VDLVFILDVITQFNLAYVVGGRLVGRRPLIAAHYMTGWFVVDFLSVIPFDVIGVLLDSEDLRMLAVVRGVRLLRILKLLRVFKMSRILARCRSSIYWHERKATQVGVVVSTIVIAHWMATINGLLASFAGEDTVTWATVQQEAAESTGLSEPSAWYLYVSSLYWASSVLVGVGIGDHDMVHMTTTEQLCVSGMLITAGAFWARMIGVMVGLVRDDFNDNFTKDMDDFNSVLRNQQVPEVLRRRCREFLIQQRQNTSLDASQRHMMKNVSPALEAEVNLQLNHWIDTVWYFRQCCSEFCVDLVSVTLFVCHSKHENFGAPWSLYILRFGDVVRKKKTLSSGAVWGEDQLLLKSFEFLDFEQAVALSYCEVLQLKRRQLCAVLEKYPEEQKTLRKALVNYAFKAAIWYEVQKARKTFVKQSQTAAYLAYCETIEAQKDRAAGNTDPLGPPLSKSTAERPGKRAAVAHNDNAAALQIPAAFSTKYTTQARSFLSVRTDLGQGILGMQQSSNTSAQQGQIQSMKHNVDDLSIEVGKMSVKMQDVETGSESHLEALSKIVQQVQSLGLGQQEIVQCLGGPSFLAGMSSEATRMPQRETHLVSSPARGAGLFAPGGF